MTRRLILPILPFLLFWGCASLPTPTPEDIPRVTGRWPHVRLADLQLGRKLFAANCASCHTLYSPSKFSTDQWEKIMVKMQKKAKIDDAKRDSILMYLTAFSKPIP